MCGAEISSSNVEMIIEAAGNDAMAGGFSARSAPEAQNSDADVIVGILVPGS